MILHDHDFVTTIFNNNDRDLCEPLGIMILKMILHYHYDH